MSKQVIVIDTTLSAATFIGSTFVEAGQEEGLNGLGDFFKSVAGGVQSGSVALTTGAVPADGYFLHTGAATAAQTCSVLNVTFTAVASNPGNNEFVPSATPATQATNLANAINASTTIAGRVVASVLSGRTVMTAAIPGAVGNGFQASAGNLSNVTLQKAFSGGSDGDTFTL